MFGIYRNWQLILLLLMTISTTFMELIGSFGNKLFSLNCKRFHFRESPGEKKTLNHYKGITHFKIRRLI